MTCYICLEDCESESPCQCKAKVHIKCLMEYSIATKTSECSICKQRMEQIEALALLLEFNYERQHDERKINAGMCVCLTTFLLTAIVLAYIYAKSALQTSMVNADVAVIGLVFFPASALVSACLSLEKANSDAAP